MPIYEYECQTGQHRFEVMQKITEEPLTVCQVCQAPAKKLISQTHFKLNGTGWYATDYAKKCTSPKGPDHSSDEAAAPKKCGNACGCAGKD